MGNETKIRRSTICIGNDLKLLLLLIDSEIHAILSAQNRHLRILLKQMDRPIHPGQVLEIIIILHQGDISPICHPDSLVIHHILIEVIGTNQKLIRPHQIATQPIMMHQLRPVIDHENLRLRIASQFIHDMHHLQTLIVRLDDERHQRLIDITLGRPIRITLLLLLDHPFRQCQLYLI